ncbi:MAG TPA: acetate--CoA ligase [Bryobacteraceae bacterium]|nr:acetate--CoA ligase [Bryobacteraceae bacterium]
MSDQKVYLPNAEFVNRANVQGLEQYRELYRRAEERPEEFWGDLAKSELEWFEPWSHVFEWDPPFAKWFVGGKINASYNCLDRHLSTARKNKVAILWEGEPGDQRMISYQELHRLVCRFANVLKGRGLKTGDRAVIYMGMIPELPVAMLACARLGITHSVVFGGFSSEALKARIQDLEAAVVITADGSWRRGREVNLKQAVDDALPECPSVRDVIVYRRTGGDISMQAGRDHWWQDLDAAASEDCPAERLDAEHPLYVLYTSGTTGKPKGIVHTTAGYLLQNTVAMKWVFDLKEEDTYWCTADIGWVTGHSYIVYGPLSAGATSVMYEGAPDYPQPDRFWRIVEKYRVNTIYTSPTAIRAFVKMGDQWPAAHDLSSLRLLGSVGEPINPAAWEWYNKTIGGERCPIVDTWWQTETGSIMIAPLPGAVPAKPGSATLPLPGVLADVVDLHGNPVGPDKEGFLIIRRPWPGMFRTLWRDPERYAAQYWQRIDGVYMTGDAARRDQDGYYHVLGRVDDVMNVSGHRLSTMEIESALVKHPAVAEAAVVGKPHEITGQSVAAFVTLKKGDWNHAKLAEDLRQWVGHEIGAFARPEQIRFTDALPKTRSGKIMRRLLREIVTSNEVKGDVTTLEDFGVVSRLASQTEEEA